jgi:hypothetical protein
LRSARAVSLGALFLGERHAPAALLGGVVVVLIDRRPGTSVRSDLDR